MLAFNPLFLNADECWNGLVFLFALVAVINTLTKGNMGGQSLFNLRALSPSLKELGQDGNSRHTLEAGAMENTACWLAYSCLAG